jgi:hypothetical protein
MFNIGDFVTFFPHDETFEHVHHDDVDRWVNGCSWYKVIEFDGTHIRVCPEHATHEARHIPIANVFDEYQVFTKEELFKHLKPITLDSKYHVICHKVKQLYRKHNQSDSSFKFKGV